VISLYNKSLVKKSLNDFEICRSNRGIFHSKKMNVDMYPANEMEFIIMQWLDLSPVVLEFLNENLSLPYLLGAKMKIYHPDFDIRFKKFKEIWELKRTDKTGGHTTKVKAKAGKQYATENGYRDYRLITVRDMDEVRYWLWL
jgi:hypothetical protein